MLKLTKTGIGLLTRQYRSVLHKCWMINVGLWQAMGDAVSKAVSVPARLIASLLSSGTLNGEAFNVLDEILLSRLFERKLASLTAIGLTIAALALPSNAEAAELGHLDIINQTITTPIEGSITGQGFSGSSEYGAGICANGGSVINKINVIFKDNYMHGSEHAGGGAIALWNTKVTSVTGSFINNHIQGGGDQQGGAIFMQSNVIVDTIDATFTENHIIGGSGGSHMGSAITINNTSYIGLIKGNFSQNYIQAEYSDFGGTISTITGDIGNINATFSQNYVSSKNGDAYGGAIYNQHYGNYQSSINSIIGSFTENYVKITESGNARGGAIANAGIITNIGTATNKVTFSGNYAKSESGSASGGAIYNEGTIENIYADFIGNYVSGDSGAAGGAIYNSGVIGNVTGDFIGNLAEYNGDVGGLSAVGGVIYNTGTMTVSNSEFKDNVVYSVGGVFDNQGNLSIINSNIYNNKAKNLPHRAGDYSVGNNNGTLNLTDTDVTLNVTDSRCTVGNYGALNITAQNKDVAFYGNKDGLGFLDITNYTSGTTNLNANIDKSIRFGGIVENGGTININNNASNADGDYIFNNAISGVDGREFGTVNLYNNADVKFGSLTQADSSVTYGSFALNSLTTDENGGHIDMRNSHIESNSATTLTLGSQLKIGIDLQHPTSGTTGLVDNITYTTGSGSIIIDAINEINGVDGRPSRTGTFTYQVLNGSGVTLAVDTALINAWASRKITTGSTTPDTIAATTNWGTTYYYRTPYEIINGTLSTSGNNLVYTVSSINLGEDLEKMGDTLALVTTATNNASRIFSTTDATAEYLLSTNLGAVNAVYKNLSINGTVSSNNRSTLNLGNYNGFVLDSSDDNLSLSSMKVSGGNDYSVNLANSGSKLDVADVVMDNTAAPITGAGNVEFTGTNEINTKVLNTGTTTVSSGTTDFNDEVAGFTVSAPATVSIAADNITAETTNNGTLELEGGNVTTKLMGAGRMKLMSGNVRLLSSTPPATTGSLSFGSSSDYADSILTSSSAASTSDHAMVTAGYLDNNYYMNYGDSMAKSFIKAANDNNFTTLNCVKEA